MLGNWAMGSPSIATTPTMTMRMEITMATMGRLIKNLAMGDYLFFDLDWAAGSDSGLFSASGLVSG